MFQAIEIGAAKAVFDEMDTARKVLIHDIWNVTCCELYEDDKSRFVNV